MIQVEYINGGNPVHVGTIPYGLSNEEGAPSAREQLHANYSHGGGWHPFRGFKLKDDFSLVYPGDPPLIPRARIRIHDEIILIYDHAWVAIIQPDLSFEVCRMD